MSSSSDARSPVELLADEFLARCKRGEKPTIKEYCDRHPDLADEIRDVFEAVLMVEDLKPGSDEVSGAYGNSDVIGGKRLEQVGDYRILSEIGRGGMGVVYEAEQQALGRRVALKVLPRTSAGDGSAQVRFQREAKAAARMHHTNIVPVFDVGQDGEHLYYAMQLIHGQGLDLVIDDLKRLRAQSMSVARSEQGCEGRGEPTAAGHALRIPAQGVPPEHSIAASLVTGQFEKENLAAPADDAGATATYEASAPSSAMLPGQSDITTATSNRGAYFRSIAQIGVQTATALSYAHSRGIIHRDIKPGNLILDTTGNVWVTDFGLAKTGDSGVTHTGDILGTIRYMSPERFRGQCDVRADVYALGMTLYEMLTLKAAYTSGDRLKLIELIRQQEATRPRSVDARIPRDLETIVMKAIDKDPRRRYQSADEMGEDLQRFVNDEPIKARRVGQVERFTRWCRRNPAIAGLIAAVLLLMAAGTAVSTWQAVVATRAREELAAKHAALAEEQARVEARFALAQKAIALFHTGVSEDMLLKNAEFKELRTKLLKEAAGFYADLEKLLAGQTDAKSRKALAAGYLQLGELTDKIGSKPDALAVHRKTLALRRELAAVPGADLETRLDVARSLEKVGLLLYATGDNAGALAAFEEQRDIAERLEALDPTDAVRPVLAKSHHRIGLVYERMGKLEEALASDLKALAIFQKLVDANPTVPQFQDDLEGSHNNIGMVLAHMGKPEEALASYGKALTIAQKLADANPTVSEFQSGLAFVHGNTATLLIETGKPDEGLASYRKILAIFQKLVDANPAVTEFRYLLASAYNAIGWCLLGMAKPGESAEASRKALDIMQELVADDPANAPLLFEMAYIHSNLGRALDRQKRFAEAFTALDAGMAINQKLAKADPNNARYNSQLGQSHSYRGGARVRAGQPAEGAADLRRALELWAKVPHLDTDMERERSRALAFLAGLAGDAKSGVTKEEAKAFADQAVAALRDGIKAGWNQPNELKEPDFDALRGRADFQRLVAEVEEKAEKH